ncbi:uncharacterized protein EV154DRAFT_423945 [Mucor mucedo]|uniref:uncharacterized protein n=1 Tax=Mucor mucedo TaxID=29922 RepID=UPI00222122FD|nr:uncharacterized protein EV154DRAFT_423945 [Mucor mucedo]KAI7889423.1 hypothetical protein EV154DRAFT_423945 [Mucor mucedo]
MDTDIIEENVEDQIRPPILDNNDLKIPRHWRDEESKLMSNYRSPTTQELVKTKVGLEDILEADNSIKMWWYDAFGNDNGQIYLFGKVSGNVFQPRVVTLEDVQIELAQLLASKNIKTYKTEVCTRKYAFELTDVPKETQYIKLTYSYRDNGFSASTSGVTFSRMFGTEIKPLKQFIIQNDIMGPCWLHIRNWGHAIQKRSCCAVEVTLYSHGECSVIKDTSGKPIKDGPPLNVLALSLDFRMNYIKNENEILAIGGFSCPDVDICNQETATSSPFERFSFTRSLPEYDHSPETFSRIREEYEKTHNNIIHKNTEEAMLRAFLSKLQQVDADIVIGHNFTNSMLDILLHRMRKFKIENWSLLGRRILTELPSLQPYSGGMGFSYTQEQSVMCGRLVCDTYTASQDLLTCKSYQLSDMALSELDVVREPYMIKNLDPALCEIELARHCSFDAYLAFEIAVKLQILPLTKQLTNLSGNLWSRSMNGARAERNEYLLSHAFYNEQFICPDRPLKNGKNDNDMESKNSPVEPITSMSFEGGLVLEPQSGFHDKYVLLLDFNSLYPSIMQEYNVCFTTMHRTQPGELNYNPDDIPAIPDPDCPEGILPRLVRMFVEQRKHVKKLMKDPTLSASTKKQYHIEQMGLKLTANSMYGCLGSSISSYYARPLAMFITSKGREILQKTVELTQQMGYKVLYGDTDSIMVETKVNDFASAEAIARKIKTRVNKEYKYLEIDLDGMFRNTLLLKKKKYAGLLINKRYDGHLESTVEAKGLEIVRRDFCDISKRILKHVLTMILTSTSRSDLSKRIRFFIEEEATSIKKTAYPFNDFIIRKQIAKEPEHYKNPNMPQVAVARIMRAKSLAVNENDIIPYIMCKSDQIGKPIPRMPEDVAEGKYAIDFDYYISHQILPPLRRLCEHIPGKAFDDF